MYPSIPPQSLFFTTQELQEQKESTERWYVDLKKKQHLAIIRDFFCKSIYWKCELAMLTKAG